jgi:glutamine synthetase
MAEEPLRIVQHTAQALGLPLLSLEIELGPSQVEAVFEATDALTAADNMVLFRNGVRQALRRAGYHASFMCRPPFPNIMSSGWHLHQSLVDATGANAFMRDAPAPGTTPADALHTLSDTGAAWLGGLLAHARGMASLCTPTVNGFGRFRPNALAPQAVLWGRDNRGAMLRVVGGAATAPRASKTASASRRPTPTCTWPRRSTPGWTAWRAADAAARHRVALRQRRRDDAHQPARRAGRAAGDSALVAALAPTSCATTRA